MNKMIALIVGALLLLLLLVFSTTYTVSYHEVAVRKTFGKSGPESVKAEPGLKFKWPLIQDKAKYDTRLQILESPIDEVPLVDGQQVVVKAFLLWRVDTTSPEGPYRFDKDFGDLDEARGILHDPFVTAVSGAIGGYRFDELIGAGNKLDEAEGRILASLADLRERGVEPVAVGVSQVMLPERATNSVILRMAATREKLAEAARHGGTATAQGISVNAARLGDEIRAFASQRAVEIQASGQAKAAQYMERLAEEEDLAIFLVWLDALESALAVNSTFVLDGNLAPWHLMKLGSRTDAKGIPQQSEPMRAASAPAPPVAPAAAPPGDRTLTLTRAELEAIVDQAVEERLRRERETLIAGSDDEVVPARDGDVDDG